MSVKWLRAITLCIAFILVSGYNNSNYQFIWKMFCSNTMCSDIHWVQKRILNHSAKATFKFRNIFLRARCARFPLMNKQLGVPWSLVKWFIISKEIKNQFKMLLKMCIFQNVQMKNVFTFQSTKPKLPVSTSRKLQNLLSLAEILF